MPCAIRRSIRTCALSSWLLLPALVSLGLVCHTWTRTRQAVPVRSFVLPMRALSLTSNHEAMRFPLIGALRNCTLAEVKLHKVAKLTMTDRKNALWIEDGHIIAQNSCNAVVSWTVLHHLVMKVPHDSCCTGEITVLWGMSNWTLSSVHVEIHTYRFLLLDA